ncbi:MAG: alpha/beta hydrolase [Rhodoferax sp.]|nr:alpha/beta hydrolase [Rhodoferax sp.]
MPRQPAPQWYDSMYNNRLLVPEFPQYVARWTEGSAQARRARACHLDIPYGSGAREQLDIFPADALYAPVLFFIHGGYWRSLSRSEHSFVGAALARAGACVVLPSYDLCPGTAKQAVTIPKITMQVVQALAWTWRNVARCGGDPQRITVAGHSAGGHLAATMLACRWQDYAADLPGDLVKNALSISGLHELESIRRTPYLQTSLRLTRADATRASPAWMPAPGAGVLNAVVGGNESAEFRRQNWLIQSSWGSSVVPVCEELAGHNHFSELESLTTPDSHLQGLALRLLGLA